jgi:hypothetical protein
MDVSQNDGADIVKVDVAKRGTWRTVSRRSGRVTLMIEYDTLCLVCESAVPNILRILVFSSGRLVGGVHYVLNALGSCLSIVRTVPAIPLFAVLDYGKLLRIALYASLEVCNGITSTRRRGRRNARVAGRGIT